MNMGYKYRLIRRNCAKIKNKQSYVTPAQVNLLSTIAIVRMLPLQKSKQQIANYI